MATKLISRTVAITMAAAMLTSILIPVSSADAGGRKHHRRHHYNNYNGQIVGAGILGLALGAIIIGSSDYRRRRADHIYLELPAYAPPQYVYDYQPDYYYETPEVIVERPYRNGHNYNHRNVRPEQYRSDNGYKNKRRHSKSRKADPKVITYDEAMNKTGVVEPWTPAWRSYCRAKFRSFNATSGTFLGFDGKRHFCVPK